MFSRPVSSLGGPIPPDPIYEQMNNQHQSVPASPTHLHRMRPEGYKIMQKQNSNEITSILTQLQRQSNKPPSVYSNQDLKQYKDFTKENIRRMRDIQARNKQRAAATNQPIKGLWQSQKYDYVQPKVTEYMRPKTPATPRPESTQADIKPGHETNNSNKTRLRLRSASLGDLRSTPNMPLKETASATNKDASVQTDRKVGPGRAVSKAWEKKPARLDAGDHDRNDVTMKNTRDDFKQSDGKLDLDLNHCLESANEERRHRVMDRFHKKQGSDAMSSASVLFSQRSSDGNQQAKSVSSKNNTNFIKMNALAAKHHRIQRCPSESNLSNIIKEREQQFASFKRGVVPKYLKERQRQWLEDAERRRSQQPDPDLPPGHVAMPQEERKEMLGKLRETENMLIQQLNSMPLRNDTLHIRRRKEELHKKLGDVEEGIRIFSRPKVFVREDM